MSTENINYGETFCDAIDIIVSQKLKQLGYDVTKACTIVDNTYGSLGRYTVQEETIKYEAYSTNKEFQIGDAVLVTIPNGDYNMQKMILSKIALDDDLTTAIAYTSPLKQMLDFTGNIVQHSGEESLLANGNVYEKLITSISWNTNEDDSYSDYTRMGVSAEFQSWLKDLNTVSGSYGLIFYFYDYNSTPQDKNNKKSAYSFTFSAKDMLGSPYGFEWYAVQEKIFDISYLKDVTQLDIYFYQNGDFLNVDGDLIPTKSKVKTNPIPDLNFGNEAEAQISNNLFVKNLQIYLGYDVNAFSTDTLRISTNDATTYSAMDTEAVRSKHLLLKWIHKIDDGKYELLNSLDEDSEVYWVRYGVESQAITHIVGAGWGQNAMSINQIEPFRCTLIIDDGLSSSVDIQVKAVGRVRQKDGNWAVFSSNVLTFASKDPRVDQTTYSAAVSLSISCLDGSEGNYLIYNQNSELINEGQGQGFLRTLHLYYKGQKVENSDDLKNNIASIQWIVPVNNDTNEAFTMLHWQDSDWNSNNSTTVDNFTTITLNNPTKYYLQYSISNSWYAENAHNTIQCKLISKTGIIYETSKELIFGKANSQGSNFSLVLQYEGTKNAYEVATDNSNTINVEPTDQKIKGLIYDLSGKAISTIANQWTWEVVGENFTVDAAGQEATIKLKTLAGQKLSENAYNLLKVSYKYDGTNSIVKYFPIAIKTLDSEGKARCSIMEGAKQIVYNSAGVPSYYTGAYLLKNSNNAKINVTWSINTDTAGHYPTLATVNDSNKALLAKPMFIKDYDYQVVVKAKNNNTIYWIQPICIMQSAYDFAITNEWNGTSVLEDGNSIIASVMAAGKKDTNGKFSGIMIGDTQEEGMDVAQTGLYGILEGVITFSLTDSGNVFFNIDSNKEIKFGADNEIFCYSEEDGANYKNSFLIDIDERIIEFQDNTGAKSKLLLSTGSPYLRLLGSDGNNILNFTTSANYLQSSNFNTDNKTGVRLNLNTKNLTGYSDATQKWYGEYLLDSKNFIEINTTGENKVFKVGKLSVNKDGEVFYGTQKLEEYIKSIK